MGSKPDKSPFSHLVSGWQTDVNWTHLDACELRLECGYKGEGWNQYLLMWLENQKKSKAVKFKSRSQSICSTSQNWPPFWNQLTQLQTSLPQRLSPDTSFYFTKLIGVTLFASGMYKRHLPVHRGPRPHSYKPPVMFWLYQAPNQSRWVNRSHQCRKTFWLHLACKPVFQRGFTATGYHFAPLEMQSKKKKGISQ